MLQTPFSIKHNGHKSKKEMQDNCIFFLPWWYIHWTKAGRNAKHKGRLKTDRTVQNYEDKMQQSQALLWALTRLSNVNGHHLGLPCFRCRLLLGTIQYFVWLSGSQSAHNCLSSGPETVPASGHCHEETFSPNPWVPLPRWEGKGLALLSLWRTAWPDGQ